MSWAKKIFANTLFVASIQDSKEFYSRVFEKSPIFEDENSVVFQFGEVLINLLFFDEAPGLIAPAKVAHREDGSVFQLTIRVDDVDARIVKLQELGVVLINGPLNRPWGSRTALFADPDGHLWEIAQG
jgi:catechol 2,3-dioxygenase-like lactoylglutathione lyase family enzyme